MVSDFCAVNAQGLQKAKAKLEQLLPRESATHHTDMALLSLIWPYGFKRADIIAHVEAHLARTRGVIRHRGDRYESSNNKEAEWVMGLPWLGIAHFELGDHQQAAHYLAVTEQLYTDNGLPEAYLANNQTTFHTPLAWAHALSLVLRHKLAS